jgi:hypothetical protein
MQRARTGLALVLLALLLAVAAAALAQTEPGTAEPRDQIVLSGDVQVRRGQEVGEIVVLHGTAKVGGVVRGDVVVLDGRIGVTGQVSGAVVSVGGSVTLGPSSRVLGDVLAHEGVVAAPGARVDGDVREGVAFTFRTPIEALGAFAPWLAVWFSCSPSGCCSCSSARGPPTRCRPRRAGRRGPRSGGGSRRSSCCRLPE